MSPLHLDKELPADFRRTATVSWKDAAAWAEQTLEDSRPELAGSIWNTGYLWKQAQELAGQEPVKAAALLLVLAEQDGLILGSSPV
jgi:hypothetical protein